MKLFQWDVGKIFAGVITSILLTILGFLVTLFVFFIEARYLLKDHEETIDKIQDDLENMPKRIIDEINYRKFLKQMAEEGIERDTTNNY